jgi:NitT/TauT family transport system substrate-binding protein
VAATFRISLAGLLTHPDIKSIAELKGHTILLSTEVRSAFWPWLRDHFGFDDSQVRPYNYTVQPFIADPTIAMQAFVSSEPYALKSHGVPYRFFPLSSLNLPGSGNPLVTSRDVIARRRDDLSRFLRASMRGWADWLANDPAPGNAAIRTANPMMTEEQILWSRQQFRALDAFGKPGTPIGPLDPKECRALRDFLVQTHQLPADAPWEQALDLSFAPVMDAVVV